MNILQKGNSCNQKTPTEHESPTKVYRVQQAGPKKRVEGKVKSYARTALQLYSAGFEPIPIAPNKKYPKGFNNWQDMKLPIKPWPKDYGVGIRCGKVTGIDIDILDPKMVAELLKVFNGLDYLTRVGLWPKLLIPVLAPEIQKKLPSKKYRDKNGSVNQIEILSHGNQFVSNAIHPDTGKPYTWSGDLVDHSMPIIPLTLIETLFERFYELAELAGWKDTTPEPTPERSRTVSDNDGNRPGDRFNRSVSLEEVLANNGWIQMRGGVWKRPGKRTKGHSGIIYGDRFVNFSSSSNLEVNKNYDPFGLLVTLEYGGDFVAATRAVGAM